MKQLLTFFIISFFSFVSTATEAYQVPDTLNLFENITDISRQIQQRTTARESIPLLEEVSPENMFPEETFPDALSDTLPEVLPEVFPPDTILLTPTLNEDTIIVPVPFVSRNPLDSIYTRKANGTLQLPEYYQSAYALSGLTFNDTIFYNPLFLPMIYNGKIIPRDLTFYSSEDERDKGLLIPQDKTFAPRLKHVDFIQRVRRDYYMEYPDRVRYSVLNFSSLPSVRTSDEEVRESFNPFRKLLESETAYSLEAPGVDIFEIERKYWVRSGEHSFQFAQNYFSDNWHKGGTNNLNFNSYHVLRANYKKEKVKFNNTIEWRLSVFNAPDDSLREYRIGNDLLRYYGDFGIDAFVKGWSYSMNMEAKSQLFNSYPTNSNDLRSALLSPLYVNAGVGLKYAVNKKSERVRHRNVKWDLAIAPISINYRYVGNDSVDVVRYGIPEGDKSLLDLGSTITSILKYDFTRYISWDSRLTYFTSYDKVITEFENSLNMALSNAFSTRLYLNVRFDDSVPADPTLGFWQVNQTLSFGLNYKW